MNEDFAGTDVAEAAGKSRHQQDQHQYVEHPANTLKSLQAVNDGQPAIGFPCPTTDCQIKSP